MGIGANIQVGPNPEVTVAGRNFLKAVHTADVKAIMLDSTAVDAGNTPTTTLRAGLFLGLRNETSMFVEYDDDGTNDGRRVARGILMKDINLLDENATGTWTLEVTDMGQAATAASRGNLEFFKIRVLGH